MMPLSATLLCIFCQLLGIPISWKKTAVHSTIDYIGWRFNFNAGIVTIPIDKILKLRGYIEHLISQPRTTRKSLEKLIGLAMWITQLFPLMRIWIHYWYHDLYTIPATHFSIDAGVWPRIHQYLTPNLTFHTAPLGSAIPLSGKLISVRHQTVSSLADLSSLYISKPKTGFGYGLSIQIRRNVNFDQCEQNRIGTELLPQMHVPLVLIVKLEDLFAIIQEFNFGFLRNFLMQILTLCQFIWTPICNAA